MKSRRAAALLAVFLSIPGAALCALSIDELDANASLVFIGSNPPSGYTDPSLAIPAMIGVSIPMRLAAPFFLEGGIDFTGLYYEWTGSSAVVTQEENGVGFFTIGTLISLQGGVSFPIAPAVSVGGAVGLDFFLRFPFELQNTTDTDKADQSSGLSWFYQDGRFFYPETRFFLRWRISDPVDLLVNLRAFYPVFHLWDGAGQPFWDELMISAGIGFGIRLHGAPK
ncbi:MAG: hypothetical protein ACLQDL_07360 [Spirochaetia bacterium]